MPLYTRHGSSAPLALSQPFTSLLVYHSPTGWMLDTKDDPSAPGLLSLFGTTRLPLTFGPQAHAKIVCEHLSRLNPGVILTHAILCACDALALPPDFRCPRQHTAVAAPATTWPTTYPPQSTR